MFFKLAGVNFFVKRNLTFGTFQESIAADGDEKEVSLKSSIKGMPVNDVSSLVRKKLKRPAEDEQKKAKKTKDDNNPENAEVDFRP